MWNKKSDFRLGSLIVITLLAFYSGRLSADSKDTPGNPDGEEGAPDPAISVETLPPPPPLAPKPIPVAVPVVIPAPPAVPFPPPLPPPPAPEPMSLYLTPGQLAVRVCFERGQKMRYCTVTDGDRIGRITPQSVNDSGFISVRWETPPCEISKYGNGQKFYTELVEVESLWPQVDPSFTALNKKYPVMNPYRIQAFKKIIAKSANTGRLRIINHVSVLGPSPHHPEDRFYQAGNLRRLFLNGTVEFTNLEMVERKIIAPANYRYYLAKLNDPQWDVGMSITRYKDHVTGAFLWSVGDEVQFDDGGYGRTTIETLFSNRTGLILRCFETGRCNWNVVTPLENARNVSR